MSLKEDRYSRKNQGRGLSLEVFLVEKTGRLVESHFIGGEVTLVKGEELEATEDHFEEVLPESSKSREEGTERSVSAQLSRKNSGQSAR